MPELFTDSPDKTTLWIYSDIGEDLGGISAREVAQGIEQRRGNGKPLTVRINSPGGIVDDGIAILNAIKPTGATVIIDGGAASAASVIAMGGRQIVVHKNSMLMVHSPWGFVAGSSEAIRKYADILDGYESRIVGEYAARAGKTPEDIKAMLAAETWLYGSAIKEAGFADVVLDEDADADPAAIARWHDPQQRADMLAKWRQKAARAKARHVMQRLGFRLAK